MKKTLLLGCLTDWLLANFPLCLSQQTPLASMSEELAGNVLAIQSGSATAVTNAILSGIVSEALNHDTVEEVYGVLGGLSGLLREDIVDLAEESQQCIRGLGHTPGAALGSNDIVLEDEGEIARAIDVLEAHNVRFLVVTGSAVILQSLEALDQAAQARGYALRIIGVPHHSENSIGTTDHCPGFGSAMKQVAATVKAVTNELQAVREETVAILEVSDSQTGWLIAGSTLAKQRNRPEDAPHVLCMPEIRFSPNDFLEEIQNSLKKQRSCVVVTSDLLFDSDGNYLGTNSTTGAQEPIADFLRGFIQEHLGIISRIYRLGSLERLNGYAISEADQQEACQCGEAAIRAAIEGKSSKALILLRSDSDSDSSECSFVDLGSFPTQPKAFPAEWVHDNGVTLRHQFYKYALPLIQGEIKLPHENGLPTYVRLSKNRVERKLESYHTVA